jgi:hypothetical protein
MVNVRLLRIPALGLSCIIMFAFFGVLISTTQLIPQLTQELLGYDTTNAGLTLGAGGLMTLFFMPIAGAITGRYVQPKYLIVIALIGVGWALLSSAQLDLVMGFWSVAFARISLVAWLPFLFIPITSISYVGVPPDRMNEASALINLMRNPGQRRRVLCHHSAAVVRAVPSRTPGGACDGVQWFRFRSRVGAHRPGCAGAVHDHELFGYILGAGCDCSVRLADRVVVAGHA